MKQLILASASPRRREILDRLGITYTVCPAQNEAEADPSLTAEEAILQVARSKAEDVAKEHPRECVLGADTAVVIDGVILGKPQSEEDAKAMLRRLSGRTHHVITAVWVCGDGFDRGFADVAEVEFYPMSEKDIDDYVATKEPMDKAGSYGIQGFGARYIRGMNGDFYTVMGLPAGRLYRFLDV